MAAPLGPARGQARALGTEREGIILQMLCGSRSWRGRPLGSETELVT